MPLFLNAEPASTGTIFSAIVDLRIDLRSSSSVSVPSFRYLSMHFVIVLGDVFDHFVAMLFVEFLVDRRSFQRRRNVRARIDERLVPQFFDSEILKFRAQRFFQPDDRFFFEEIDDADEIVFAAERELQRNRMRAEPLREWCAST